MDDFLTFLPVGWEDRMFLIAEILGAGALVLLAIELGWMAWQRRLGWSRVGEMAASYSTLLPTILAELATGGAVIYVYYVAAAFAPWEIPVTWVTALLALLLVDFIYYWEHRWSHEIRLLWAVAHSVHHSSKDFNQATAYRITFLDGFISPVFYLPLVLIGFPPLLVLAGLLCMLSYQTWIHTEMIGRLGWFDGIFNSPSNHRVHHGIERKYCDRNYGGILILWDRMFGTYQREEERPRYGIVPQLGSINPWHVHMREISRLLRDLGDTANLAGKLRLLIRPPGWKPAQPSNQPERR